MKTRTDSASGGHWGDGWWEIADRRDESEAPTSQLDLIQQSWHCTSHQHGNLLDLRKLQEAQLSPRDQRDALYQLKCCPTVVRITQTDHVSAWGALSATATFYSATCVFFLLLYTNHCTRHNYRTASICNAMPYVSSTDFRITNLVDVNWTITVINQRRLPPVLLTTPHNYSASALSRTQTSVADGRFQTAKVTFKVTEGHS